MRKSIEIINSWNGASMPSDINAVTPERFVIKIILFGTNKGTLLFEKESTKLGNPGPKNIIRYHQVQHIWNRQADGGHGTAKGGLSVSALKGGWDGMPRKKEANAEASYGLAEPSSSQ